MKAAGAFMALPRELRHNMRAIYCKNRNGATLQTLFSGPRPRVPLGSSAVVRAGLFHHSPGPFFWIGLLGLSANGTGEGIETICIGPRFLRGLVMLRTPDSAMGLLRGGREGELGTGDW